MQRSIAAAAMVLGACFVATSARAADGAPPSDDSTHAPAPPRSAFDSLVEPEMKHTWDEGSPRFFAASTFDVGFLYVRPRISLGYGKPHRTWFGIDGNPTVAGPGVGAYAGVRLAIPHFDIRFGPRYFRAFQHAYLAPLESFNRIQLESTVLDPATTLTWEVEANGDIPVGPGDIVFLGSVSHVSSVPAGQYVFEETLRVLVAPPWVVRGRAGYAFRFGSHEQISVGIVGDFVGVPERGTVVVRVGPMVRFALSRSFEVRGSFVPRVSSPDDLGLLDSDFTELGLRWRWATD